MPLWEVNCEKYISSDEKNMCSISFLATKNIVFCPQIGRFEHMTLDVDYELCKLIQLMFKLKMHILSKISFDDEIEFETGKGYKFKAKAGFSNASASLTITSSATDSVILKCHNEKDLGNLSKILFENMLLCSMRCIVAREMTKVIRSFACKQTSAEKLISYIKNFSKCKGRAQEDIIEKIVGIGNANDMIQNIVIVKLEKKKNLIVSYVQCGLIAQVFETIKQMDVQIIT